MKKILSMNSLWGLTMLICMTSCVAKRKYVDAQNTITQLQTENAQLKESGTSMQQNITTMQQNVASLEANNRTLKGSLDSTNSWASGQQTRWNSFQAFYDEGTKTTEQVHQQLHQQMDELIGAENITTANGRVYVTLAEKTLFATGSSKLSTNGAKILAGLAQTIKDNPNVEIDIASVPGYYTSSPGMADQAAATGDMKVKTDDDMKMKDENMKVKVDKDGDVKVKTDASKQKTYTTKSTTKTNTTARKSETSAKTKTYSSKPAKKSSGTATWSLNMARSSSIAKKLVDEGVAKSRILVNKPQNSTTKKDFQVIISPKADTYYNEIGNGNK